MCLGIDLISKGGIRDAFGSIVESFEDSVELQRVLDSWNLHTAFLASLGHSWFISTVYRSPAFITFISTRTCPEQAKPLRSYSIFSEQTMRK
jgi:hypothetical protein